MTNMVLASFDSFNQRRYSNPWCATVKDGKYDFNNKPGYYTGKYGTGDAGDIIIPNPQTDTVYAYGQKDHRGNSTTINYAVWDGEKFVPCDKAGRL